MLSIAGVSVLSVKDIRVAGAGDYGMRPLLPTQAGDEPLASRSLGPRYILLGETSPRLRAHSRARGFRSMNSRLSGPRTRL